MKSLAYCLRQHGSSLTQYEKDLLRKTADEYIADGLVGHAANVAAVEQLISELQEEEKEIKKQAKEQGWKDESFLEGPVTDDKVRMLINQERAKLYGSKDKQTQKKQAEAEKPEAKPAEKQEPKKTEPKKAEVIKDEETGKVVKGKWADADLYTKEETPEDVVEKAEVSKKPSSDRTKKDTAASQVDLGPIEDMIIAGNMDGVRAELQGIAQAANRDTYQDWMNPGKIFARLIQRRVKEGVPLYKAKEEMQSKAQKYGIQYEAVLATMPREEKKAAQESGEKKTTGKEKAAASKPKAILRKKASAPQHFLKKELNIALQKAKIHLARIAKIVALDSSQDLKEVNPWLYEHMEAQGVHGKSVAVWDGEGTIYFFADMLSDVNEIRYALSHELGHYSLDDLLGDDLNPVLDRVRSKYQDEIESRIEQLGWESTVATRRQLANEIIVDRFMDGSDLTLKSRVIDLLKKFFRKLGLVDQLTTEQQLEQDIADLVRAIQDNLVNGRAEIPANFITPQMKGYTQAKLSLGAAAARANYALKSDIVTKALKQDAVDKVAVEVANNINELAKLDKELMSQLDKQIRFGEDRMDLAKKQVEKGLRQPEHLNRIQKRIDATKKLEKTMRMTHEGRSSAWNIDIAFENNPTLKKKVESFGKKVGVNFFDKDGLFVAHPIEHRTKTINGVTLPQFGGFARSLVQTYLDRMGQTDREIFRSMIVEYIEKGFKDGVRSDAFGRSLHQISLGDYKIAPAVREAEKTLGALNLNTMCPMFNIGAHGCYFDGCYVTGTGMGGNMINFYNSAMYLGEILQLSDEAIAELNKVGGLRINGSGDTSITELPQWRDFFRHASMRGLKLKVITKQDATFEIISKLQDDKDGNVSKAAKNIIVQPSLDPYWIPVERDDIKGSMVDEFGLAKVKGEKFNETIIDIYKKMGRDAKVIDGKVYRKYGYSPEQLKELTKKYPTVKVQPRIVVGTFKEIAEYALKAPEILQTWMHASIRPGMYSDVDGRVLDQGDVGNFTRRVSVKKIDGEWRIQAQMKKGDLESIEDRKTYLELELYIKENYSQKDQEKIFTTLAGQGKNPSALCCKAGASGDACNDCTSHCMAGTYHTGPGLTQILDKPKNFQATESDVNALPEKHDPQHYIPTKAPKKTQTGYKLFRMLKSQPGKIFPLFVGKSNAIPLGQWLAAEALNTDAKKQGLAQRPGWHLGMLPNTQHLTEKDRVWAEVEIPADVDYQSEADQSPTKDIKNKLPKGGFYKYPVPARQGSTWYIAGAIKVNKILTPEEVQQVREKTAAPQHLFKTRRQFAREEEAELAKLKPTKEEVTARRERFEKEAEIRKQIRDENPPPAANNDFFKLDYDERERQMKQWRDDVHKKTSDAIAKLHGEKPSPQYLMDTNTKRWQESVQRAQDMYGEILDETLRDVTKKAKKGERQSWSVVPKARVIKLWRDFVDAGFVRDEKGIDKIADQVARNIVQLIVNTDMVNGPVDPLTRSVYTEDRKKEISKIEAIGWEDLMHYLEMPGVTDKVWFKDNALRTSDYGIKLKDAAEVLNAATAEEKLLAVDRTFNKIHSRYDLASNFIEGGQATLDEIAGNNTEEHMTEREVQQMRSLMGEFEDAKKRAEESEFRPLSRSLPNVPAARGKSRLEQHEEQWGKQTRVEPPTAKPQYLTADQLADQLLKTGGKPKQVEKLKTFMEKIDKKYAGLLDVIKSLTHAKLKGMHGETTGKSIRLDTLDEMTLGHEIGEVLSGGLTLARGQLRQNQGMEDIADAVAYRLMEEAGMKVKWSEGAIYAQDQADDLLRPYETAQKLEELEEITDFIYEEKAAPQYYMSAFGPKGDQNPINALKMNWWDKFKAYVADSKLALQKLEAGDHSAAISGHKSFKLLHSFPTIFNNFLVHGTPMFKNNWIEIGKDGGLYSVVKELGKDSEAFFDRLTAKSAQELVQKGRQHLFGADQSGTPIDDQGMINKVMADTDPMYNANRAVWDAAEKRLREINTAVLNFAEDCGIIDGDTRADWERTNYIPFFRVIDDWTSDAELSLLPHVGSNIGTIQQLKGSKTKGLADPFANLAHQYSYLMHNGLRNMARKKSLAFAKGAGLVTEVKHFPDRKPGQHEIDIRVKGKAKRFRVEDPWLYDALVDVDTHTKSWKILSAPKRWLTWGVTITGGFRLANVFRDTWHTFFIGNHFIPILDSMRGAYHVWRETPEFVQYASTGGAFGGSFATHELRGKTEEQVKKLHKKALGENSWWSKAWDAWEKVGEASENAARMGLYLKLRAKGSESVDAGFEARDLLDFHNHGKAATMQLMISAIPFLNARIQGLSKLGRNAVDKKTRNQLWLRGMLMSTAAFMMGYWNADDEEDKELPDYTKRTYLSFNVLGHKIRLPIPFEAGSMFIVLPMALGERMAGTRTNKEMLTITKDIITDTFAFNPIPQVVKPVVEQWANYDFFTGQPIIPEYQKKMEPDLQISPKTRQLYKKIGAGLQALGFQDAASPKRIEKFTRDMVGSIADVVADTADIAIDYFTQEDPAGSDIDRLLNITGGSRFVDSKDVPSFTKSQERFYDFLTEFDRAATTYREYKKLGNKDKAKEYRADKRTEIKLSKKLGRYQDKIGKINAKMKLVHASEKLTAQEKRVQLNELLEKRNEIFREAVEKVQKKLEDNND